MLHKEEIEISAGNKMMNWILVVLLIVVIIISGIGVYYTTTVIDKLSALSDSVDAIAEEIGVTPVTHGEITWYAAILESEYPSYLPIVKEFEETYNITVNVVFYGDAWAQLLDKLKAENMANFGVGDVVTIDDFYLPTAKDYVANLTSYIDTWGEWDQLYAGKRDPGQINGSKYFIGWRADCQTTYVNVEKFANYGITWSNTSTIQDLVAAAQTIYNAEQIGRIGLMARKYEGLTCQISAFTKAYGGNYLTFNSSANVQAFTQLKQLGPYLHPSSSTWDEGTIPAEMTAENIYFDINWPYQADQIAAAGLSDVIEIFPTPLGPEGRGTTVGGGYLAISKVSQHKADAWKFIQFIASKRGQYLQLQHVGWLPIREDAWTELQTADPDKYALLSPYGESAKYILPRPAVPEYTQLSSLWQDVFWDIVFDQHDVQTTLDAAQASWNTISGS
jgi:ABC-type glycerol-3-phosphate transport system substrate-binding protein